ncbi:F-box domain protein [Trichuris suis]|nr:F-box domain protein [Trichuris suis]
MEGVTHDYSDMPLVPLLNIFKYLDLNSRCNTMAVCRKWRSVMMCESIWHETTYDVPGKWKEPTLALERIAEDFGGWHRKVTIRIKGSDPRVAFTTMNLLCVLSELLPRRIQCLTIQCVQHGGLCRHGENLALCIRNFFDKSPNSYGGELAGLLRVDLSCMTISVYDPVITTLFNNHGQWLTHVNLQNRQVHCRLTAAAMRTAVKMLTHIEDFRTFMACFDNDALKAIISSNQGSLRHLSFLCRYADAFRQNRPTESTWQALNRKWPEAAVTLTFSRGYPPDKFRVIMLPSVPLKTVCFEQPINAITIALITDMYKTKLHKVVLRSKPVENINNQLANLVLDSAHLRVLYVMHNLEITTATLITERRPKIKHNISIHNDEVRFDPVPEQESSRPFVPNKTIPALIKFPYPDLWNRRDAEFSSSL